MNKVLNTHPHEAFQSLLCRGSFKGAIHHSLVEWISAGLHRAGFTALACPSPHAHLFLFGSAPNKQPCGGRTAIITGEQRAPSLWRKEEVRPPPFPIIHQTWPQDAQPQRENTHPPRADTHAQSTSPSRGSEELQLTRWRVNI